MQELHNDLLHEAGMDRSPFETLLNTAKKWADYCLTNHEGRALNQGLEISKALANYHFELHRNDDERL